MLALGVHSWDSKESSWAVTPYWSGREKYAPPPPPMKRGRQLRLSRKKTKTKPRPHQFSAQKCLINTPFAIGFGFLEFHLRFTVQLSLTSVPSAWLLAFAAVPANLITMRQTLENSQHTWSGFSCEASGFDALSMWHLPDQCAWDASWAVCKSVGTSHNHTAATLPGTTQPV